MDVKINAQAVNHGIAASAMESSSSSGRQTLSLPSGVQVDEVWITTGQYAFAQGEQCAAPKTHVDLVGPLTADLMGDGFVGGQAKFPATSSTFCDLALSFALADKAALPASVPADVAGSSVVVRGKRGDGVSFTIRSSNVDALKVKASKGQYNVSDHGDALILAFDLEAAINAATLESAEGSPIVLDENTNAKLLDAFEDALRKSVRLYPDNDGNGKLTAEDQKDELGADAD